MAPNRDGVRKRKDDGKSGGAISKEEVRARGTGVHSEVDDFLAGHAFSETRVFLTGLMFLTRLPCPGWVDHHPAYFMRSLAYFPLFGLIVGLWAAVFYDALDMLWSTEVAAILSTLSSVWLTGCFHEDGLGDTFDGFGGGWSKAEILHIMKDSRVGTYGAMGMIIFGLLKFRLLAELGVEPTDWAAGTGAGPALVAAHSIARATSAPLVFCYEFVQDDEDAKGSVYNWFAQSRRLLGPWRTMVSCILAAAITFSTLPQDKAFLSLGVGIVASWLAGAYGRHVIGGVMGDFLGCTIAVTECLVYMALLADFQGVVTAASAAADTPQDNGMWGGWGGWLVALRPVLVLLGTATIPVIYMRSIIAEGGNKC
ncbi:unnamed protein product [Discosporangium mesarthrocarpum]